MLFQAYPEDGEGVSSRNVGKLVWYHQHALKMGKELVPETSENWYAITIIPRRWGSSSRNFGKLVWYHQHTLKMGKELVPETSENLYGTTSAIIYCSAG